MIKETYAYSFSLSDPPSCAAAVAYPGNTHGESHHSARVVKQRLFNIVKSGFDPECHVFQFRRTEAKNIQNTT